MALAYFSMVLDSGLERSQGEKAMRIVVRKAYRPSLRYRSLTEANDAPIICFKSEMKISISDLDRFPDEEDPISLSDFAFSMELDLHGASIYDCMQRTVCDCSLIEFWKCRISAALRFEIKIWT